QNAIATSTGTPANAPPGYVPIATLISAAISARGDPNADISNTTLPPNTTNNATIIRLSGGSNTPGALSVTFRAQRIGTQGNSIVMNFTRADLGLNKPPTIAVSGNTVNVTLNTTQHGATGTTVND